MWSAGCCATAEPVPGSERPNALIRFPGVNAQWFGQCGFLSGIFLNICKYLKDVPIFQLILKQSALCSTPFCCVFTSIFNGIPPSFQCHDVSEQLIGFRHCDAAHERLIVRVV